MTAKNYDALYFPYTKCFDSTSLKRALLYFDRIHFMDPFSLEEQEKLVKTSHYYGGISLVTGRYTSTIDREVASFFFLDDVYRMLGDKGIIVDSNIYSLIHKFDKELTANTMSDLSDEVFCRYSYGDIDINEEYVSWYLLTQKTPPSLLSTMKETNWKTFRSEVAKNAVIFTDMDARWSKYLSFKEEFNEMLPERSKLIKNPNYTNVYVPSHEIPLTPEYGEQDGYFDTTGTILPPGSIVPFAYGASISISQAMLYAAINDLTLFTDSETMHYLLARKCQLAFESSNPSSEKLRTYTALLQKIKENDLVISAIDALIPRNNLRNLEFTDVLKLRQAFSSPLKEFRAYISEIATIKSAPWEKSYYQEIQEVSRRIEGDIRKLQSELALSYQKIFRSTLQSLGGISLGIAIMPHNLTIGSVIALLAAKDIPLNPIFQAWEAKANAKQHSVSYLINIDKSVKKAQSREENRKPWNRASGKMGF